MRGLFLLLSSILLASPVAAQSAFLDGERARLRSHFDEVLAELEAADTSALSPEQRARRMLHLQRLAEYRDRGVFPLRYDSAPGRVPEFRDVHGTRCAMGELIYLSGETQLVDDVATTANSATIAELSADPRLTRWLGENGLSVEEAGRIQPQYPGQTPTVCVCNGVPESIWTGFARGEPTPWGSGDYQVQVELLERLAGSDTLTPGQLEAAIVHFLPTPGTPLIVSVQGFETLGFPSDATFETMSCSTEPHVYVHMFSVCNADHPISVEVAVEAMNSVFGCYDILRDADPTLGHCGGSEGGDDGGCAVGHRGAGAPSQVAFACAFALAALVVRRRRRG